MLVLLSLLFAGMGSVIGGHKGVLIVVIMMSIFNFVIFWFSDKLSKHEVSQNKYLNQTVKELAKKIGIETPKIGVIASYIPYAYVIGRNPKHSFLVLTSSMLNSRYVSGVLSHELTHLKYRDSLVSSVINSLIIISIYFSLFLVGLLAVIRLYIRIRQEYRADLNAARIVGKKDMIRALTDTFTKFPIRKNKYLFFLFVPDLSRIRKLKQLN